MYLGGTLTGAPQIELIATRCLSIFDARDMWCFEMSRQQGRFTREASGLRLLFKHAKGRPEVVPPSVHGAILRHDGSPGRW
jgi:hypothetical protein